MTVGFSFHARAVDGSTGFVVNVCGHASVGVPLARNKDPVPDRYLDEQGVENLLIPIAVGAPQAAAVPSEWCAYAVDVVVHPALLSRCRPTHRLFRHYIERLSNLAVEWVLQECGVRLESRSCRLLGAPGYYAAAAGTGAGAAKPDAASVMADLAKLAREMEAALAAERLAAPDTAAVPAGLANIAAAPSKKPPTGPLVQEVRPASTGIKKGFLVDDSDGRRRPLYGPGGSGEGEGKRPDPLAHIPESLRARCQIVDLSKTAEGPPPASPSPLPATTTSATSPSATTSAAAAASVEGVDETSGVRRRWRVEAVERQGDDTVVVRFSTEEEGVSMAGVSLDAAPFAVAADGTTAALPVEIDTDGVTAKYVRKKRLLCVSCPVKGKQSLSA